MTKAGSLAASEQQLADVEAIAKRHGSQDRCLLQCDRIPLATFGNNCTHRAFRPVENSPLKFEG